jgi:hypothetical protein
MVIEAVGAGPADRRNYRSAGRLDCSERVVANITLSLEVELVVNQNALAFGPRIIHIPSLNGNVRRYFLYPADLLA